MLENKWSKLINHDTQTLEMFGLKIVVRDQVFSPDSKLSLTAEVVIENIGSVVGLKVADVGTGSGVIAMVCALRGAKKVIATDVSQEAIINAQENVYLNSLEKSIRLVKTNLLDDVDEKFDVICANLPILETLWEKQQIKYEELINKFFVSAKQKLNPGARVLIPTGSFSPESVEVLESISSNLKIKYHRVEKKGIGLTWYCYIFTF